MAAKVGRRACLEMVGGPRIQAQKNGLGNLCFIPLTARKSTCTMKTLGWFIVVFILLMGTGLMLFLIHFVIYWVGLTLTSKVAPKAVERMTRITDERRG